MSINVVCITQLVLFILIFPAVFVCQFVSIMNSIGWRKYKWRVGVRVTAEEFFDVFVTASLEKWREWRQRVKV
jgi:hypothetical protein